MREINRKKLNCGCDLNSLNNTERYENNLVFRRLVRFGGSIRPGVGSFRMARVDSL